MEPRRGILIREVAARGGMVLKPSEYVWILGAPENGRIPVESRNHRIDVPEGVVLECPVPRPDLDTLRKGGDCFGRPDDHFMVEYKSGRYLFRRCAAGGTGGGRAGRCGRVHEVDPRRRQGRRPGNDMGPVSRHVGRLAQLSAHRLPTVVPLPRDGVTVRLEA